MNTKYTIKNFRVFDEKGVTVDIKPITILTGCNSSGKSSIVKSMVLLNTYIESLQEDYNAFNRIDLQKHKLDFTKDSTITLGNFNRVRHNGSDEKTITFQYQVHSLYLGEDVVVSMVFGADENDALNNGYILEISISKLSGETLYLSSKNKPFSANYNLIRENFFRFVYGQFLVYLQKEYKTRHYHLYGLQSEKEFHDSLKGLPTDWQENERVREADLIEFKKNIDDILSKYLSSYKEDTLDDIEKLFESLGVNNIYYDSDEISKSLLMGTNPEIVYMSQHRNTFFYFPLFEKICDLDKSSFKSSLISMLHNLEPKQELLFAIEKISADFESSSNRTFGDYFRHKESSFFMFSDNLLHKHAPLIEGTDFFNFDWNHDNYLGWSARMLGPVVVEVTPGNLTSMVGMGEFDEWKDYPVNFSMLYNVLMNINNMLNPSESPYFYEKTSIEHNYKTYQHHLFDTFKKYASMVMREVVTTAIPQNLSYIGTSLVNVKRDYSFDSNDSFTNLIKRYFVAQRAYKNSRENSALGTENFISKWVRKLGLGYSVSIEVSNSGSSFVVRLYKNENDKVGNILAEEGYGVTQIITLLIRIETAILESKKKVDVDDHELPICTFSESTIAVEEPEVHLHPRFQSILAEMFVDAYKNYNVHFIIETHSEYLIRKLQTQIAKKDILNCDISIIYVYDNQNRPDCEPQVKRIDVSDKGMLLGRFGDGFYDEADELSMTLLMQQRKK